MSNAMRVGALASLFVAMLVGAAGTAQAACSGREYLSQGSEDTISWNVYYNGMTRLIQGRGIWNENADTVGVKLTSDFETDSESNMPYIEGVFVCDPPGSGDNYRMRILSWGVTSDFRDRACLEESDSIVSAYIRVCLGDPGNDPW